MAAPTPTARGTPTGRMLDDGFRCLITLSTAPTISFWEKQVKPSGYSGGDKIDVSTMHNIEFRGYASRALMTGTDCSFVAAYDPNVKAAIRQQINREQTITETYPDGTTVAYFGFLKDVEFDPLVEGTQPQLNGVIVPTNRDSSGVEQAPVITNVSGT